MTNDKKSNGAKSERHIREKSPAGGGGGGGAWNGETGNRRAIVSYAKPKWHGFVVWKKLLGMNTRKGQGVAIKPFL